MMKTLNRISEREALALGLLQYAYRNIGTLTPKKMYAKADALGVKRRVAEYMLEKSGLFAHNAITGMHVYSWNLHSKADGKDVIPNVYMVRTVFDAVRADRQLEIDRKAEETESIKDAHHPVFVNKIQFKAAKFVTHMRMNSEGWAKTADIRPSDVMRELNLGMEILTVMTLMNVVLTRGSNRRREYMWNPCLACDDALVLEILEQRKLYSHDRNAIKKYPDPRADASAQIPKAVQTGEESGLLPVRGPAVDKLAPGAKTENSEPGIRSKGRSGYKQFAWTDEEEWAVIEGLNEGMDYKGIASLLGRSPGSVSGKIHFMKKEGRIRQDVGPLRDVPAETATDGGGEKPKKPRLLRRIWNAILNI